jgi:hypothetical protein
VTLVRRIEAIERSPAAERRRLLLAILNDAEAMDLAARTFEDRDARFQGVPPEAFERLRASDLLQRSLREAFAARVAELKAGVQAQRAQGGHR